MDKKEYVEIDLLKLIRAVMRKIWAVILSGILVGGIALGGTIALIEPKYEANAVIYVNNNMAVGSTDFVISSSAITAAQELVNTYIVILNSRTTINEIIEEAGVDRTYKEVKDMMEAAPVDSTEIFEVIVTSTDPEEATKIANAVTQVLPNRIADIVDGSSVRIVDYAVIPSTHASPNYTMNAMIGVVIGAFICALIIIIRSLQDKFIRDESYLSTTYENIPVLSSIPNVNEAGSSYSYKSYGYAKTSSQKATDKVKVAKDKDGKVDLSSFDRRDTK